MPFSRKTARSILVVLGGVLAQLLVLAGIALLFVIECVVPAGSAQRVLVRVVAIRAGQELARTGKLRDLDAELRSEYPHVIGLDRYKIIVQKTSDAYDVVIKPSSWCFCRPTFILHDGGRRLEVVQRDLQWRRQ